MAMSSYTQRKSVINQGLRRIRAAYRRADSLGEQLERELDRLILRKTLVEPGRLSDLARRVQAYRAAADAINAPLTDTITIASV